MVSRKKILLIEDDYLESEMIESCLTGEFEVITTHNGSAGVTLVRHDKPDLVILDVMLPGIDGYSVCRNIRSERTGGDVPILFLTAKTNPEDRIAGFIAGGDDYLCKPFELEELTWRVKSLLKRADRSRSPGKFHPDSPSSSDRASSENIAQAMQHLSATRLKIGSYILDTRAYELLTPARGRVRLTPMQFKLLVHLMSHPGQVFTTNQLLDEVWGYPPNTGSPDLVRVHIKKLRERIEKDPRSPAFLRTISRYGYMVSET